MRGSKYFSKPETAIAFQKEAQQKPGVRMVMLERSMRGGIRANVQLTDQPDPATISWLGANNVRFTK